MTVTDTPEITTTELLSLYEQMEVIRRTEKARRHAPQRQPSADSP